MRKDYIKYSAKRLMDIFYQEYPHLDKHKADRRCVANILNYIINEYADCHNIIHTDNLDELIATLGHDEEEIEEDK